MQDSRNTYIQIKQNIFALKALFYIQQLYIYAASRNCIYFKEMIYLLTIKEILILSSNIYLFTKSISIRRFCYHLAKKEKFHPKRFPSSDTISSPKSDMPASEPFISKGTIKHSSNCEFLLKIYHFLSFWKSLSSTKLTYTQTLSAQTYALTLVLMRTSRKTHFRL